MANKLNTKVPKYRTPTKRRSRNQKINVPPVTSTSLRLASRAAMVNPENTARVNQLLSPLELKTPPTEQVSITIGGVKVQGSVADLRKLLRLA
jgi:hypothetical protein